MRYKVHQEDSASYFLSMNQQGLPLGAVATNNNKPDFFLGWLTPSVETTFSPLHPAQDPRSYRIYDTSEKKILLEGRRSYVVELIHQNCSIEAAPFC
jgi:hypothetical protein